MQEPPSIHSSMDQTTPMTRVELSVSAVNLKDKDLFSKSDPVCIVYSKEKGHEYYNEIGRTEQIKDSLNPEWVTKFELDYYFEERQLLRFHIYDWDTKSKKTSEQDSLGYIDCSLAEIMAFPGSKFRKALSRNGGTIEICGEEIIACKEVATFTWSGRDLEKRGFFTRCHPFLTLYRVTESNDFVAVHRTDPVKNTLNPVWPPVAVPIKNLCNADEDKVIKIACYDWSSRGNHSLIGECQTTLKVLKEDSGSKNVFTLMNAKRQAKKRGYKGSGRLILNDMIIKVEPSFLDYIRGGCQLHFTVAVDFTASNGNPSEPTSLHYRQPGVDNQYSMAIKAVGEIIQDYDSDKMFPALGFGARIPPNGEVSHEFFLNGRQDSPYCEGLEGLLQAYQHSLETDLPNTKKALVEASSLPMSVIIVGVGSEDFSVMELLDSDDRRLCANGIYAERDIVQFVELRRHLRKGNLFSQVSLAKDVLAEIPLQFLSWMTSRKFTPKPPTVQGPLNTYGLE